jgi:hypothetical protein
MTWRPRRDVTQFTIVTFITLEIARKIRFYNFQITPPIYPKEQHP